MKTSLLLYLLLMLSPVVMISAMAQENHCVEMDLQIESSADLDWAVCFIEKDTTLKINTFSGQPTENKIVLQKDIFWDYHFDCSPREFQTFLNDEYINFKEEYFDDHRILYVSLEKGQNEILIGIPALPPNLANSICPGLNEDDPLPRSLSVLLGNHERPSLKEQLQKNTLPEDLICKTYMELIVRPDHNGVACVTSETKEKLIERGWMENIENHVSYTEPTFLSKTATEWKSMSRNQLGDYYENYPDKSFFSDLGRFLIKDEMKHEMEKHGIQNKYDDFAVYAGLSLTSLPPHIGFSAVVNATDQKIYLLGGGVFGNTIESVNLRELVFHEHVLNHVDGKNVERPYEKLLKTEPQVSILEYDKRVSLSPHTAILDLEQRNSVAFHNKLEYPIRIEAYIPDNMDTILKSGTISPNQTDALTFENIGMYEYDVLGYPDNDSGLWDKKEDGEINVISEETENLQLEEKLEIARSFLYYAKDDIPYYSISTGNGNGELSVGIRPAVEKSIPDYQEYYEKRIQQWIPFEIPINVE